MMTANDERMPWTRDLRSAGELRQWLASREKAADAIVIETCEIGTWYINEFDPYNIRLALKELPDDLIDASVNNANFVRSTVTDGWIWEGDLPKEKIDSLYRRIHAISPSRPSRREM